MARDPSSAWTYVAAAVALLLMIGCTFEEEPGTAPPNPWGEQPGTPNPDPIGPEVEGSEESVPGGLCKHPAVAAECSNGGCKIPMGCFWMGSPETEPGRNGTLENLVPVDINHDFEISVFEVTQAEWAKLVPANPSDGASRTADCISPSCPVGNVTWFEAAEYANLLSERHVPPLAPCYELVDCQGEMGKGRLCTEAVLTTQDVYQCHGYRLPTEDEWEYAARAGTRTAYYSGDISVSSSGGLDPNLEPIAWCRENSTYANTKQYLTHFVGQKHPNRWGLFDMLGNVAELTSDSELSHTRRLGRLVTDQQKDFDGTARWYSSKGGFIERGVPEIRAAAFSSIETKGRPAFGFRLVRTLPAL